MKFYYSYDSERKYSIEELEAIYKNEKESGNNATFMDGFGEWLEHCMDYNNGELTLIDGDEYREKLSEEIENVILSECNSEMTDDEIMETVLESGLVNWIYDDNGEPWMVEELVKDYANIWH